MMNLLDYFVCPFHMTVSQLVFYFPIEGPSQVSAYWSWNMGQTLWMIKLAIMPVCLSIKDKMNISSPYLMELLYDTVCPSVASVG